MEETLVNLLKEYGYIILFFWSILEGETGLVMAGILSHTGDMNLYVAIVVAAFGGFTGDQIYFYIGRYNKSYVLKLLKTQRRKFALATILLRKYGWPIIFIQRYLYGLRTIIPMSIGITNYSAKKFALINLISAFFWASLTIVPSWYFGKEILEFLKIVKSYWYIALPFALVIAGAIYYYFHKVTKKR